MPDSAKNIRKVSMINAMNIPIDKQKAYLKRLENKVETIDSYIDRLIYEKACKGMFKFSQSTNHYFNRFKIKETDIAYIFSRINENLQESGYIIDSFTFGENGRLEFHW